MTAAAMVIGGVFWLVAAAINFATRRDITKFAEQARRRTALHTLAVSVVFRDRVANTVARANDSMRAAHEASLVLTQAKLRSML